MLIPMAFGKTVLAGRNVKNIDKKTNGRILFF